MAHHPLCFRCGRKATEAAHCVANTIHNTKKYGFKVVNHRFNLLPSCHPCNSYAMRTVRDVDDREILIDKIKSDLKERGI